MLGVCVEIVFDFAFVFENQEMCELQHNVIFKAFYVMGFLD